MSKMFKELKQGLEEAIQIQRGEIKGKQTVYIIEPVKTYSNNEIKKIRNNAGMTQNVFAAYMGVSKKTVESWERGTNHPTGSACRLLDIISSDIASELPFIAIK